MMLSNDTSNPTLSIVSKDHDTATITKRESLVTLATDIDESSMFRNTMNDSENDDFDQASTSSSSSSRRLEDVEQQPHPQGEIQIDDSSSSGKHCVRFGTIQIREYPMTLGDNPSVSSGVPVTIEWTHEREITCDLSDYESNKQQRRSRLELVLPEPLRMDLVLGSGTSRSEIKEQRREVNVCKYNRKRTLESVNLWKVQEALEVSWRATMNATFWQGKKRMERKYIAQALATSRSLSKPCTCQ